MDGVELGKELWSCFKCPISTPSHGLAEEVKVRFGGQNDYPSAAWARVKDLPCREESWWDLKKKETSVTCKSYIRVGSKVVSFPLSLYCLLHGRRQ